MFSRFIAAQLRRPSGWFGRHVMTRMLNRGNSELINATLATLKLQSEDHFVDVGFGGGGALLAAAKILDKGHLIGVDFSPDVVAQGKRRMAALIDAGRMQLCLGDVADLPIADGSVNKVATTNTIYFWPEPKAAVVSLLRVLAPGGALSVGFSGKKKMESYRAITAEENGFRRWTEEEVLALLRDAGFVDVQSVALDTKTTSGDFVVHGARSGGNS